MAVLYRTRGSGAVLLIWIRIDPGSGSRSLEIDKINKYAWFPVFQKGFCTFVCMFFDLLPTIFHVKNSTFVILNSDKDPDTHGSASALKPMRIYNIGLMY